MGMVRDSLRKPNYEGSRWGPPHSANVRVGLYIAVKRLPSLVSSAWPITKQRLKRRPIDSK